MSRRDNIIKRASERYLGKKFTVNCGWSGEVIDYKGNKELTVVWQDGSIEYGVKSGNLNTGYHRPKMYPGVVGVGIFDKRGGPYCKDIYWKWSSMIKRSYCPHYHKDKPTYKDVEVCDEWKIYSNFSNWAEKYGPIKDLELDKDFLGDGKLYSPETCCFVPSYINGLDMHRINKSTGVSYHERISKWEASVIFTDESGKVDHRYLGVYSDKEDAHRAYIDGKREVVKEKLDRYRKEPFFDKRVEESILNSELFSE